MQQTSEKKEERDAYDKRPRTRKRMVEEERIKDSYIPSKGHIRELLDDHESD